MATKTPQLVTFRDSGNDAAVVFLHGFSGDARKTWGEFPQFLAAHPKLKRWDIFSVGYPSRLMVDLPGLWSADPPISILAEYLRTLAKTGPLARNQPLAIVAHSMGGLVAQRALVDDADFVDRVSHLFLFGTPSAGLAKAGLLARLKRQPGDMACNSDFIRDLRRRWNQQFDQKLQFKFVTAGGNRDEFVPPISSIEPFPAEFRGVVSGNHLQIVKPESAQDVSVQLVVKGLLASGGQSVADGAQQAVEIQSFRKTIKRLWPNRTELDPQSAVKLALAMEGVGESLTEVVRVLEPYADLDLDALGVLAGRCKRLWLQGGRKADGDRARALYGRGFDNSEAQPNHEQAFYHGINLAFLELSFRQDRKAARAMAERVLEHCAQAAKDKWSFAAEGEAQLICGNPAAALDSYAQAVAAGPTPRELDSMYQQAVFVAGLAGSRTFAGQLEAVFQKD